MLSALKRFMMLTAGGTPSVDVAENWAEEGGTNWVTIGDMTRERIVIETDRCLTDKGVASKSLSVGPSGTLLFAMYASVGEVAVLGTKATWNQAILGMVPRAGLADASFARYWLQHLRPELTALFRSNTQNNLNAEQVGDLPFPVIPLAAQRAIADHLDAETIRIDALIEKKRRMIELLEERWLAWVDQRLVDLGRAHPPIPLKHATREITVGIVVTPSDWYAPHGIPALRGLNVRAHHIVTDDMVWITPEGHSLHRKSALSTGDIVTVRTGQAGATAVVPPELSGANCIDLLLTRPSGQAAPEYLSLVLNSRWARERIIEYSVGAIQSHFNVGSLRELLVPLPSIGEQTAVLREATALRVTTESTTARLSIQIALLAERRQALITAAVTGQAVVAGIAT